MTATRSTPPSPRLGTVVITGGSGKVARPLREALKGQFEHVRIVDIVDPAPMGENESWVKADISDLPAVTAATEGADSVIHLAMFPTSGSIEDILRVNALGTYNIYEAARINRTSRIVLGSTNHVTGFYSVSEQVAIDGTMRPDSIYGLSKCWSELTAGLFFDKAGIRTLIIRIGNAAPRPADTRSAKIWISARDLAQLVMIGLTHADIDCTMVYGTSDINVPWWNMSVAERLGYQPQDNPRDFLSEEGVRPREVALPEIADHFQGGRFCVTNHDGTLRGRRDWAR